MALTYTEIEEQKNIIKARRFLRRDMRIFVITFALVIVLCSPAFSDVVYFKDGGKVEGIIMEKTGDYVVVDIGVGTMSVRMDEVDYIEEATSDELERLEQKKLGYEIERGEWAPEGYEDLRLVYLRARDNRGALKDARRKSKTIKTDIAQKESYITELLDKLKEKSEELKEIDSETDVEKYNEVIAEMNSLSADLNNETNSTKALYDKDKELAKNLGKLASKYRSNFQLFEDILNNKKSFIGESDIASDELYFIEEMEDKIRGMTGDFKKDVTAYTSEGNQIIVDALIDSSALARLVVDTGATIVLISTDVAYRLGIKYEDIHTGIEIIMADGSSVEAKPVILKSVKVGDAEVKNVQAAILEKGAIGGVDGLLGMSFLNNFVIKVDSAQNKLILERVL
jgi:clan AA aspartic protease (TIGR02281 family)